MFCLCHSHCARKFSGVQYVRASELPIARTKGLGYSSSISPSSLPECTAGSSFAGSGAGGVLVRWRRSRGGPGERSRGLGSLLVLCICSSQHCAHELILWQNDLIERRRKLLTFDNLVLPTLSASLSARRRLLGFSSPQGNSSMLPRGSPLRRYSFSRSSSRSLLSRS